jgi:Glycosyl transferase family 2
MTSDNSAQGRTANPWRLSVIIEWANTTWNGEERALRLLDRLAEEWGEICADRYPNDLPAATIELLKQRAPRLELLIVSGEPGITALEADIRRRLPESVDLSIHIAEGLEYYPLKNFGAGLACGEFLLFVDSDVLPERGWLAHLLGSFARPDVHVVAGQTYVEPHDFMSRTFALGWSYQLRDASAGLYVPRKFYANNIAFRAEVFRQSGFPPVGLRSRGACSLLGHTLRRRGIQVWENRVTGVDHPPPSGLRHITIRALVHGRDYYLHDPQQRSFAGVTRATRIARQRLVRGYKQTLRHWRTVGLHRHQVPAAMAVMSFYYALVALGGLLTHVRPALTVRFRL